MTTETHHLSEICDNYLHLAYPEARRRAALNRLPFPTFRLNKSAIAPLMVSVADLAAHIDKQAKEARAEWELSNSV